MEPEAEEPTSPCEDPMVGPVAWGETPAMTESESEIEVKEMEIKEIEEKEMQVVVHRRPNGPRDCQHSAGGVKRRQDVHVRPKEMPQEDPRQAPKCNRYSKANVDSPAWTPNNRLLRSRCTLCGACYPVQSTRCNLCGASYLERAIQCNTKCVVQSERQPAHEVPTRRPRVGTG